MSTGAKNPAKKSFNASHDPNASYLEQVGDNMEAVVEGHKKSFEEIEKTNDKVLDNENATDEQKLASTITSVSEKMMAVTGAIAGVGMQMSEAVAMPIMQKLAAFKGTATLPVCKQMDPVIGIDVHMIVFPPVPAPVPIPHPYAGISFRAKDFIACAIVSIMPTPDAPPPVDANSSEETVQENIDQRQKAVLHAAASMVMGMLGATVKFGGYQPRTVAGTPTKNIIKHFAIGPKFHPVFDAAVAKNHGHALLGSFFVVADGSPLTGAPVHLHNDCWDVGIPSIHNIKPNKNADGSPAFPARLYVPSGVIMPIPWTRPVLTNPIPSPINPLVAPLHLFKAAFAKLLHGAVNKCKLGDRASDALHKLICHVTGHPVDVVSGMLFTDEEDFKIPGIIPLSWERTWYSDSRYKGPLGHGWHHNYDCGMFIDEYGRPVYRMNDGRLAAFEWPEIGKFKFNRNEKLFLHRDEGDNCYISDRDGLQYRFTENLYKRSLRKERLLKSISNANGFTIQFEYNHKGNLVKITDTASRVITVEHDLQGRIVQMMAPHPAENGNFFAIAKYAYDDEGNMICHTDALAQKMLFEYESHLLVKETWRDGMQWYFRFDGKTTGAKCIHTWGDHDIYNHRLQYYEGKTIVVNSLGNATTYNHKNGQLNSKIDGNGAEWQYRYNRFHELEWQTDPLGNQRTVMHDNWGNITGTIDPSGGFIATGFYNTQMPLLPTEAVDAAGGKWVWKYDERGNLVERINPLNAKSRFIYEDALLVKIISPAQVVTTLKYDSEKNLVGVYANDGVATLYEYDNLGNCILVTNPNGALQKRMYDLKGRVAGVKDFDGNKIELLYDGIDNVIRYTDKHKEVDYTYRGLWKLTSRTEAGATIYFNYDTEEQLRKIINEHGLPYRFDLDAAGNVIEETGFDNITRQYMRNKAGWVEKILRPAGKYTNYIHDQCGRVTQIVYSDSKRELYTYRTDGELMSAINDNARVELERNVMGDITKEKTNDEWVASTYDAMGNRTSITSSLGADISHAYNKYGDVLSIKSGNWSAGFTYDKLGLEVQRLLPGGINAQWQRDAIGRPVIQTIGHSNGNSFATRKRKQYTWDVNDRLKKIKDEKGVIQFEHDQWSNLAKTIYPNGEEQLRNPDAVGNLFATESRKDRVYAKGGQLKKANGWNYEYDEEGNLIRKLKASSFGGDLEKGWLYKWNDAGMLTGVTRPDGHEVSFTYDALGRRLNKRFKHTITKFVWDGNVPLHEWKENAVTGRVLGTLEVNEDGDLSSALNLDHEGEIYAQKRALEGATITWLFDASSFAPAAKIKGDKTYSIVTDHLGTPSQMYKEDGSLFWEMELDSYGKVRVEKGEVGSCPFRYQGQYEDAETGLYYNRFRYYSGEEGMYISQDPIGLLGGMTVYCYVGDTSFYVDIFGLSKKPGYGEWKKRRNLNDEDTGLKDHARRHSNLSPSDYLKRGQKNMLDGVKLKGDKADYYVRKIGDNDYSVTITNKKGEILSIDTWSKEGKPLSQTDITKGLKNSGVTASEGTF